MLFHVDTNTKMHGYKEKVMELTKRYPLAGFLCELDPVAAGGTPRQQLAHAIRIDHKRVCAKITSVALLGDVFTFNVEPAGPLGEVFSKLISTDVSLRVSTRISQERVTKSVIEVFGFDISRDNR